MKHAKGTVSYGSRCISYRISMCLAMYARESDITGRRWKSITKEKNIADVLDMTIEQARDFFSPIQRIHRKLDVLCQVGLGYMRLGQPSTTAVRRRSAACEACY